MLQLYAPASVYEYLSVHDTSEQYRVSRTCNASLSPGRSMTSDSSIRRYHSENNSNSSRQYLGTTNLRPALSSPEYDIPRLTKTPWELERSKRRSVKRVSRLDYVFPDTVFKTLPREVYDCIVEQLGKLHQGQEQHTPSNYLRDLYHLSLTSRAWDRAVRLQLYQMVWVLTNEEHPRLPKLKIRGTGRLKLLRRTLRERQALARCVRTLQLSEVQTLYQNASIEREEITNLVASLVMACPNIEKIVGFQVPYTHSFDRLSHALSTRRNMKERVWLLSENTGLEPDEEEDDARTSMFYHAATEPTERFLELNSNHPKLTTLVLSQQQPRLSIPMTFRAIIGTLRQFPSLRHLSISGISATSFNNVALNALPPRLHSLRLESLPGINDKGLQRFAKSHLTSSLQSVKLINLEISNLATIAAFLSPGLPALQNFALSQNRTPLLKPASNSLRSISTENGIPTLSSNSLQKLHWELRAQISPPPALVAPFSAHTSTPSFPFTSSEPIACLATALLSTYIKNNTFPALVSIRVPHDPQGLLQQQCRPRATALLPGDMASLANQHQGARALQPTAQTDVDRIVASSSYTGANARAAENNRADSATNSPMSADFPLFADTSHNSEINNHSTVLDCANDTSIHHHPVFSRLHAQSRILSARTKPSIQIRVFDPDGHIRVCKTIYAFMGKINSNIVYEVETDEERCGVVNVKKEAYCRGEKYEKRSSGWVMGINEVCNGVGEREPVVNGERNQLDVMELF